MKPDFDLVVKHYIKLVYYYCRRLAQNLDADDLVQDTFTKAIKAYPNFNYQSEPQLKTWLLTICHHTISDYYRQPAIINLEDEVFESIPDDSCTDLEETIIETEQLSQLNQLINDLPSLDQSIINLKIHEELTFGDIAKIMNSSEAAIKMKYYRCLSNLKAKIYA